ncbi:MAG: acetate kinase [Clostridia bacterium]|nr:acetate kinase [Clostridia bacterium]MBQ2111113.1 acetate kinase [Clostridia bacterium]MBQ3938212.1 acetate kinase [Clostridia bacterium]MBR4635669.1 acetate kinase [Clostridia bacterium]
MKILVINAGSSSLKYQLIDTAENKVIAKGLCERIGIENSKLTYKPAGKDAYELVQNMKDHTEAIKLVLDALVDPQRGVISSMAEIDAVGHRIVHGGEKFAESVLLTDEVLETIESLNDLAPLHNPANLMGIRACKAIMPNTPMVGVFDTAFHQTMPPEAFIYALPYEAYTEHMVRRYGFHGTSHKYVTLRAIEMLGKPAEETRIITCHLGNGSSVSAIKGGKCIDTSMGLTPLEGLPMGTRSGDIDPAIVGYLARRMGVSIKEMDSYMNKKSGMLGISGVSSDFRDLSAAAAEGNERAELALKVFAYHVKKYIGAYAAVLDGVDAIVFTAGVGENDRGMRERILTGLDYLGLDVDFEYNRNAPRGEEIDIAKPESRVRVFVIPTDEELMIARDAERIVKAL